MLSDYPNVYAGQRMNLGETLLRYGDRDNAMRQFNEVISLGSETQMSKAYSYIGLIDLFNKKCADALTAFTDAQQALNPIDDNLLYESITYRDCVRDVKKADELLRAYRLLKGSSDTQLEQGPQ